MRRVTPTSVLMVTLICLQAAFWWNTQRIRPPTNLVLPPPSKNTLHALSLGDEEFYFREQSMLLQNSGDHFGRSVSLRYLDYVNLFEWLTLLDTLDSRSDMLPALAADHFSDTQTSIDNRYMVNYLYAHGTRDVAHKWWWLLKASYLAMHSINDMDLALKVAKPMVNPAVPVWAQQMVAVVYEKRGEMENARRTMSIIQQNARYLSDKDRRYISYFVENRLKKQNIKRDLRGSDIDSQKPVQPIEPIGARREGDDSQGAIYSSADIRALAIEGVRLGMTQEEALKSLKKGQWKGEWHPFVGPQFDYPFTRNDEQIYLLRIRSRDGKFRIWSVAYSQPAGQMPNFDMWIIANVMYYGEPTLKYTNATTGAYAYYLTGESLKDRSVKAPRLEVTVSSLHASLQLVDDSMLNNGSR